MERKRAPALPLVRFATQRTLHKLPGAFFNRSRSPQAQGGPPPMGSLDRLKKSREGSGALGAQARIRFCPKVGLELLYEALACVFMRKRPNLSR
jgi:hypothetical protein